MKLGAHESGSGGIYKSIDDAVLDGCESLQVFVKSPNRWNAPALKADDIKMFIEKADTFGVTNITSHTAYLINLASPKEDVQEKSIAALIDEMKRCDQLKIPYNIMHPGSPLDSGLEMGIEMVINGINTLYNDNDINAMLLLEITAGAGNSIGGSFDHLEAIIDGVDNPDKVGICLDSCHMFSAGYDIVNNYDRVFDEFFRRFEGKLKVFHLNDSKTQLGMRKDRHELIGKGEIGIDFFKRVVNDKRFADVLGILETPADTYLEEVTLLKSLREVK